MGAVSINLSSDSLEPRLIYFTPVHMLVPVQRGAEYRHDCEVFLPLDQAQKTVGSKTAKISKPAGAQEQCSYD